MRRIFRTYLSDPELEGCLSDERFIRHMLDVEIALAGAQARLGMIPPAAAAEIADVLGKFDPDPGSLTSGTLANGIPVIPLLHLARERLTAQGRDHLHWGTTSQDIMDCAQVLLFREAVQIIEKRLYGIIRNLENKGKEYKDTPTVARTRSQLAVPMLFGHKIASWYLPLRRHLERLNELKPRLFVVQLGGAGGDLAAMGEQGEALVTELAGALRLNVAPAWHSQRDNLVEFSSWLALVSGSLGKMAGDILLLSQTEIGEIVENPAGGGQSSSMPHKENPILSEAMVALANYIGHLAGANFPALQHDHERDGSAWILEWLTFPDMLKATGAILNHGLTVSRHMEVNPEAMRANLHKQNGLVFSEKASYLLAKHMPRQQAREVVRKACDLVLTQNIHLAEALTRLLPDVDVDWADAFAP